MVLLRAAIAVALMVGSIGILTVGMVAMTFFYRERNAFEIRARYDGCFAFDKNNAVSFCVVCD